MSLHQFPAGEIISPPSGGGTEPPMELTERVGILETDVKHLQADMTEVKADVKHLQADMTEVKADVKHLQADMTEVKADVKALRSDVHGLIKWIVGTAAGVSVAAITVMTFVLNNAVPKPAPLIQPQPIIINMPAAHPAETQTTK